MNKNRARIETALGAPASAAMTDAMIADAARLAELAGTAADAVAAPLPPTQGPDGFLQILESLAAAPEGNVGG